ncbi:phytosulfokine receptor 1-like [Rutidosis leptorrhynchoides]|uniref:phytosulfokine receptor 1-like n=1 Tax=Rutidosis leptorrhynchoides TaxID=125765 RepID=UPI003A99EC6B
MVALLKIWVLVSILLLSLHSQILVISQNVTCNSNDLKGLKGFMDKLQSPIGGWWPTNSSSFNCCNWVGITCDSSSGRIVSLKLPNQRLTGHFADLISSLVQLKTLNLSHNFLKGPIPTSFFHLANLEIVDLSGNEFDDVLPVTINLPALQVLDLSDNNLRGPLPVDLCTKTNRLRVVSFAVNYFTGIIPVNFGNCSFLERLSSAGNYHSGVIPDFLLRLPRLRELELQDNEFTAITGISDFFSQLVHLDLSINLISGDIPDFFNNFPNLTYFLAHSNNLSGTIPANLASCNKLKALNLAKNNLNGQVPESFKNLESLSYLLLSNCGVTNLSAALTILQHCRNLTILVLSRNFYNEQLPSNVHLQFKSLKALMIANCSLTGSIPLWISGSTQLQLLELSDNRLTGSIPTYMEDFKSLFYLDLSNNSLSGKIPKNLTQLRSLIWRNVSMEEPSPDFPFFKHINTRTLQYNQIIKFPPKLDLSSNLLTGPIWPEFGNLMKLHVLNLQHNNLSGTIPSSLSGLISIETLDFSYNRLTGTIPPSLAKLSFLSTFSVAHNNLTGIIPSGGQFSTFLNTSFEGNPGLCGNLFLSCQNSRDLLRPHAHEEDEYTILHILVITGFGTGFLGTVISLLVVPRFMKSHI